MKRIRLSLLGLVTSILICSSNLLAQQTLKYTLVDLGLMGGTGTVANGVNQHQIIGNVTYADGHQDCFLVTLFQSTVKWSSTLVGHSRPPNYCTANAINQNGDVAGTMLVQTGLNSYAYHGFRRTASGSFIDLPPLNGGNSEAYGLNDSGIAVGQASASAVRWDSAGNATDLGKLPAGTYAVAAGINSYGTIVGWGDGDWLNGTPGIGSFTWTNGSLVALPAFSTQPGPNNTYPPLEYAYRIGSGPNPLIAGPCIQTQD